MRQRLPSLLEHGRIRKGPYASDTDALFGAFTILGPVGRELRIVSSGVDREHNWEHVSVSLSSRTPNWAEMNYVKDLFWDEEECVMQLHPPRSRYVNCHPHTLHLWRPLYTEIPQPPPVLVG